MSGSGLWGLNSFYGMMTYMPCRGIYSSYYGYRFYSPQTVGALYYVPQQPRASAFMGGGGGSPSYSTNTATSAGTSGTIAASSPASTTVEQRVERSHFQEQRQRRWADAVRSARLVFRCRSKKAATESSMCSRARPVTPWVFWG